MEEDDVTFETQENLWAELQNEVNGGSEEDFLSDETIQYLIAEGWELKRRDL